MKILIPLISACIIAAACAGKDDSLVCSVAIESPDSIIMAETEISFSEGETVADVLKKITRREKIQAEVSGTGPTAYVRGIDNLYEFDMGPESGWLYYVNEVKPDAGCGMYKVQEGDFIRWVYIIEE